MDQFLISQEAGIRLMAFAAVLAVMMVWEFLAPRRAQALPRQKRWPTNLGLSLFNTALLRIAVPVAATGAALWAAQAGVGLLNQTEMPLVFAYIITLLALDFLIYAQHVLFHRVPLLWRVHKMHHADTDLDVTSGIRFHPIEILLSVAIKMAAIIALGAPAGAVILFEILLNAMAMFNHANINLAPGLDRVLRKIIVTPDMHRVHHSVIPAEHHRNFGFNLSLWDRLFHTYIAQPREGHLGMKIGLTDYPGPQPAEFLWNLVLPFTRDMREEEKKA
ncbi:MAG: sterol desaturase family protein [Rhizobiales bacterium]|nr:sterol desaturase family protein [Hyphomicrobiales bacterium]